MPFRLHPPYSYFSISSWYRHSCVPCPFANIKPTAVDLFWEIWRLQHQLKANKANKSEGKQSGIPAGMNSWSYGIFLHTQTDDAPSTVLLTEPTHRHEPVSVCMCAYIDRKFWNREPNGGKEKPPTDGTVVVVDWGCAQYKRRKSEWKRKEREWERKRERRLHHIKICSRQWQWQWQ